MAIEKAAQKAKNVENYDGISEVSLEGSMTWQI